MKHKSTLLHFLIACGSLLAASSLHAGNTWDGGGGDANWNTPANWDGDTLPGTGALTFTGDLQTSTNNDLTAASLFAGINFTNNGSVGTSAFTLAGNSITLGGNITTTANTAGATITDTISLALILDGNRTITTNQQSGSVQHNLTISGIISETGGARTLAKGGASVLTLSGQNSYTGVTTVSLGTLRAGAAAGGQAFGNGSAVTLANTAGVILDLNGFNQTIGNLTGGAASAITLGSGNLTVNQAGTTTHAGIISGTGGLIKTGVGTLTLSNTSNAYTGGTRIDGGLLLINADAALGESSDSVTLNGGGLAIASTLSSTRGLILNNVAGNLVRVQGNQTWTTTGAVTGSGGMICRQNPNGAVRAYFYSLSNTFEGSLGIESNNNGMIVRLRSLVDSVTANGNIVFGLSPSLGPGTPGNAQVFEWDVDANAALTFDNRQIEFAQNGLSWGYIRNSETGFAITVNTDLVVSGTGAKTLVLDAVTGPSNVFAGNIADGSGTVSTNHQGSGTWTLSGTNTHSGGTTMNNGSKLIVDSVGGIGTGPLAISTSGGTNLTLNANQAVAALYVDGAQLPTGVYTNTDFAWYDGTGTLTVGPVSAAPSYWDIDGSTAGAGGATPSGTWNGVNTFWSNSAAGDATTAAWTAGRSATFAAGTDANGTYTVTVSGTQDIGGLTLEEGNVTLDGGTALVLKNDALALVNSGSTATVNTPISDDGTAWALAKDGNGTLVLTGANTYTGTTMLNAGALNVGANAASLGSGTLIFNSSTANKVLQASGTYNPTIGSSDDVYWNGNGGFAATDSPLTVSLEGGSTLSWGSGEAGFNGNTLILNSENSTSSVTLQNNIDLFADRTVTVQDNSSSDADYAELSGVIANGNNTRRLNKDGSGTLVLSGANTYTNTTTITSGTLLINGNHSAATGLVDVKASGRFLGGTGTIGGSVTLENNAGLTFDLSTSAGSHDKLDVVGSFTFESASVLTITSSGGASPGLYTLVTAGSVPTGSVPATVNLPAGWTADAPDISGNDLVINITSTGGGGSPYDTWADTNAPTGNPDDDYDGDGVSNAVEFVLGGLAGTNDLDKLPALSTSGGNMLFTFERDQDSIDTSVSVEIEVGTDLAAWGSSYTVGETSGTSDSGVTVSQNDPVAGTDTVTLSVVQTPDAKKFARLKVVIAP